MAFDAWLMDAIGAMHRPWLLSAFMIFVTTSGNIAVLASLVGVGMLILFRRGRRRAAWSLLLAGLASILIDVSIKYAVGRARPIVAWQLIDVPAYPSFPSGHAMGGLAVYATFGWLLGGRWGLVVGACWGVLIALSRVYVGVHYPTDVLAGLAIGACITAWAVGRAD